MKNKILHLLMAFVVVASVSCKKDPEDPNNPNNPNNPGGQVCNLEKVTTFDTERHYKFNTAGLIVQETVKNENGTEAKRTDYVRTSNGTLERIKIYTYGQLSEEWELNYSGNTVSSARYTNYGSGQNLPSNVNITRNNAGQITALDLGTRKYTYEYHNDNLVKETYAFVRQPGGPLVGSYEITYGNFDDKINPKSKWDVFLPTPKNNWRMENDKNLNANFYNYESTLAYTYNDKGSITRKTIVYKGMEFEFHEDFQYKCQ